MTGYAPFATDSAREATIFGSYLLGEEPSPTAVRLYAEAISRLFAPEEAEDSVLRFALNRPWSLPLLDGAAALRQPEGQLRRRLLVMFAILETQPEYADRFLPFSHTLTDLCKVGIRGIASLNCTVLGLGLLPLVSRR